MKNRQSSMRNLIYVLSEIIKTVPPDHEQFKENLVKLRDKTSMTAPEQHVNMWHDTQHVISQYFESMDKLPDWGIKFVNIWTNRV